MIAAYEEALTETSTEWAPYVVPTGRNWVKSIVVARLLLESLDRVDPQLPPPAPGIEGLRVE